MERGRIPPVEREKKRKEEGKMEREKDTPTRKL